MRKKIIAGNWKMFTTAEEARALAEGIKERLKNTTCEVVVCPPFPYLGVVKGVIKGSPIKLGAQNVHWEEEGAYTGEVSPKMLLDIGVEYVIIGHSERRAHFGETDEIINRKVSSAVSRGLRPILCVGETLKEREDGLERDIIKRQLESSLMDVKEDIERVIIAYEPVWAIGTGKTATPEIAQDMHRFIRKELGNIVGGTISQDITILYGGSVKPDNIKPLMREEDIDGALVGGASLKVESFLEIIVNAEL